MKEQWEMGIIKLLIMQNNILTGIQEFTVIKEIFDAMDLDFENPSIELPKIPYITYIKETPIDSPNTDILESNKYQYLNSLYKNKLIDLVTPYESSDHFQLGVIDANGLEQIYSRAYIRSFHNDGEPAEIEYFPVEKRVIIEGKEINLTKLSKRNRKLLKLLLLNPNQSFEKNMLWKLAGQKGMISDYSDTLDFNNYITNLRRAMGGLSSKQLILNKNVYLWAIVKITDTSDLL